MFNIVSMKSQFEEELEIDLRESITLIHLHPM